MPDLLVDRVRRVWADLARVPVESFRDGTPYAMTSSESRICPQGWVGVVSIKSMVLITAPSTAVADHLNRSLRSLTAGLVVDAPAVLALLPGAEVLGPAWLSYARPEDFSPRRGDQPVDRLPALNKDLVQLQEAVSRDEADESGLEGITSEAFVVRRDGEVVAAAGFRRWPHDVAHLCVLTAPSARERGLATWTASAAVERALGQGLLPQWRAQAAPSRRVAAHLGLRELGWQLSLRVDEASP